MLREAIQRGASALRLPQESRSIEAIQGVIPEGMPVHYVLNILEVAQRLAVAFYGQFNSFLLEHDDGPECYCNVDD